MLCVSLLGGVAAAWGCGHQPSVVFLCCLAFSIVFVVLLAGLRVSDRSYNGDPSGGERGDGSDLSVQFSGLDYDGPSPPHLSFRLMMSALWVAEVVTQLPVGAVLLDE